MDGTNDFDTFFNGIINEIFIKLDNHLNENADLYKIQNTPQHHKIKTGLYRFNATWVNEKNKDSVLQLITKRLLEKKYITKNKGYYELTDTIKELIDEKINKYKSNLIVLDPFVSNEKNKVSNSNDNIKEVLELNLASYEMYKNMIKMKLNILENIGWYIETYSDDIDKFIEQNDGAGSVGGVKNKKRNNYNKSRKKSKCLNKSGKGGKSGKAVKTRRRHRRR